MNIDTCIICFADDIEIIEYLKIPLDHVLVLTNQPIKIGTLQTELFSLETLDNILNYKQYIDKFIITQNLNCSHELIMNILNKLVIHSKTVYNYHPIKGIDNEMLTLLSKKNSSIIHSYDVYSKQYYKHNICVPQYDIPIIFSVHTCENLSMAYYMSNVADIFQKKGYRIKYVTNSIFYDLLNATPIPNFLYDVNISNILKSAYVKDYLNELATENIDSIICVLDFHERNNVYEEHKCSRDLIEEIIYTCRPDYLALGLLDNLCNEIIIQKLILYMKNKCNIDCDVFVQTPYIRNPFMNGISYFNLRNDDMSSNKLENVISINNKNCYDKLYNSIVNKLSNIDC